MNTSFENMLKKALNILEENPEGKTGEIADAAINLKKAKIRLERAVLDFEEKELE